MQTTFLGALFLIVVGAPATQSRIFLQWVIESPTEGRAHGLAVASALLQSSGAVISAVFWIRNFS